MSLTPHPLIFQFSVILICLSILPMLKQFKQLLLRQRKRRFYWVIGGISLFVGIVFCLLMLLPKSTPTAGWQPAKQVVRDKELLEKVLKENTVNLDYSLAIENVLAFKQGKLYLFDFNHPALCGQAGCLYAAYTEAGERVLSLLLNPELPEGIELLSVPDKERNKLPCLLVNQLTTENQILQSLYCYENGAKLVQVNQSIID